MHLLARSRLVTGLLALTTALVGATTAGASAGPVVAVVHSARWSQGDEAREGAAEFLLLMEVVRLKHAGEPAGLVAVGDRRGLFTPGGEEALQQAVLQGMPVVKLSASGRVMPAPHGLFLDGGGLTEETARAVLVRCLDRFGPLPQDSAARRRRLQLFQDELTLAAGLRLAVR